MGKPNCPEVQEGTEFAVAFKFYAGWVDDFFAENFHYVGGVESAVFALGSVKHDGNVFDDARVVFAFA